MNRFKREEKRRWQEKIKGLNDDQIAELENDKKIEEEIGELARKFHVEMFPEEYDFMYDSWADLKDRNNGINPMSKEYTEKMNRKREALGMMPLDESGMSQNPDTDDFCYDWAKRKIRKTDLRND